MLFSIVAVILCILLIFYGLPVLAAFVYVATVPFAKKSPLAFTLIFSISLAIFFIGTCKAAVWAYFFLYAIYHLADYAINGKDALYS